MTAQGPTKRRILLRFMRNGFRTTPARLVRGSSRRIMSLRFRPANIRVINRRASSWAVVGSAVPTQPRSQPTSGTRVPARPPVGVGVDARTVLAVKGSLRRAEMRRALDGSAPFRPDGTATGGSGGNTSPVPYKDKAGFPPAEESRPENPNPSNHEGLDRSLHIKTTATRLRAPRPYSRNVCCPRLANPPRDTSEARFTH